jgi:hypothetical protein
MAEKEHITVTPDTSHIKNIDVTHEVSDVYIGGIAKFVVGLLILIVASFVLMWAAFRLLQSQSLEAEKPRSPMALSENDPNRLPPEPRLQGAPGFSEDLEKSTAAKQETARGVSSAITGKAPALKDPMWEIRVVRDQWNDVLKNGPVDQNGQRYGMPIEQAKQEVLKQLAAQPQKTAGSKQ